MKIRIKGNSIRYRLTKTDITNLDADGSVQETTDFGSTQLVYALRQSSNTKTLSASFDGHNIVMSIPESWAREWFDTDRVGFEGRVPLSNGDTLHLLLEKDFKCLDETIEDQSDNYDNPLAAQS